MGVCVEYAMAEVKRHLFKTSGIKQNQVKVDRIVKILSKDCTVCVGKVCNFG